MWPMFGFPTRSGRLTIGLPVPEISELTIADSGALNITVMSYMGRMYFGLVADRDAVPQVWDIARGIEESLGELQKAAEAS